MTPRTRERPSRSLSDGPLAARRPIGDPSGRHWGPRPLRIRPARHDAPQMAGEEPCAPLRTGGWVRGRSRRLERVRQAPGMSPRPGLALATGPILEDRPMMIGPD